MATVGSAKSTLVDKINSLTAAATPKDTIFLAKALGEATSLTNFVWQGTWATGTEYAIDDVVIEGVSSYVCIQAHTAGATFAGDSAKWDAIAVGANMPAQTGNSGNYLTTDGSDMSWSTLPPSDDASALTTGTLSAARMPAGTILKVSQYENNSRTVWNLNQAYVWWTISHTKAYTNSKLLIVSHQNGAGTYCDQLGLYVAYDGDRNYSAISKGSYGDCVHLTSQTHHASGKAAGTYDIVFGWDTNGEGCRWANVWNPTSADDGRDKTGTHGSTVTVYEIAV